MEIFKVTKKLEAIECEKLLKKHIKYESTFDFNINPKANVDDFFDRMAKSDNAILLAAKINGQIVGYLHGFIKNNYKNVSKEDIGQVNIIFVEEKFRKQGIGKALITKFSSWLKEKNVKIMEVETYINNESAKKFYEKADFSSVKITYRKEI